MVLLSTISWITFEAGYCSHEFAIIGFEAGGPNTPSNIDPWTIIGNESSLIVATERSSCFERNKIALRMDVLCDNKGTKICPAGGVGIYNPGFWGMVTCSMITLFLYISHSLTHTYTKRKIKRTIERKKKRKQRREHSFLITPTKLI